MTNWWIIFIVAVLIISILSRSATVKGCFGELMVRFALSFLPQKKYIRLDDILLRENDETHQIDHIVISRYGIFVIETKNYKGWIFGTEAQHQWTQSIYGKKYHFENPIIQNRGHICALNALLQKNGVDGVIDAFHSIVTFPGDCELKNHPAGVIKWGALSKTIKTFSVEEVLQQETVDKIVQIIKDANHTSMKDRAFHVQSVRQKRAQAQKNDAISKYKNTCPRCGAPLVLRKGKYGSFYGCSRYPKCRYTRK